MGLLFPAIGILEVFSRCYFAGALQMRKMKPF